MNELPTPMRRYIMALAILAVAWTAVNLTVMGEPERVPLWTALAIGVATVVAWLFPIHFSYKTKKLVDTGIVFAAVLLIAPGLAMLVTGVATMLAHALRPASRHTPQAVFNGAQVALQAGVAGGILAIAGWQPGHDLFERWRLVPVMVLAGVAMVITSVVAISVIVALQANTDSIWRWTRAAFVNERGAALPHLGELGIGILIAVIARAEPWALPLLTLPAIGAHRALSYHVDHQRRTEATLHGTETSLAQAQRIASLGSWSWTPSNGQQLWSDETYRILGFDPQSFPATLGVLVSCVHPNDRDRVQTALDRGATEGVPLDLDCQIVGPDAVVRTVHLQGESTAATADRPSRLVGTMHDITERKSLEARLVHRAFHDPLTDLPNRALFNDRLERALGRTDRAGRDIAVLFIDLDGFKQVNDLLGHDAGDRLLVAVAARLEGSIRPDDTAARFGGDEFTVLLEHLPHRHEAIRVADRLTASLRQPFRLDGRESTVSASVGIAWGTVGQTQAISLLRDADAALYHAKAGGKDRVVAFEPRMGAEVTHRSALQSELKHAVARGELRLHYQPQVNLRTGAIVGFEALVRWQHPTHGLIPPASFIPLAEESGLILQIGQWALEEACRQAVTWQILHPETGRVRMAVNLAVRQLVQEDIHDVVAGALRDASLDPEFLTLEVTEHVLVREPETVIAALATLRGTGVRIALDDFGTGFSSLEYLHGLAADTIKMDKSFIHGLSREGRGVTIAASIVGLAHSLGMAIAAEGIETADQLVHARGLGFDIGQGFLFAQPLSSAEAGNLLALGTGFDVHRGMTDSTIAYRERRRRASEASS